MHPVPVWHYRRFPFNTVKYCTFEHLNLHNQSWHNLNTSLLANLSFSSFCFEEKSHYQQIWVCTHLQTSATLQYNKFNDSLKCLFGFNSLLSRLKQCFTGNKVELKGFYTFKEFFFPSQPSIFFIVSPKHLIIIWQL